MASLPSLSAGQLWRHAKIAVGTIAAVQAAAVAAVLAVDENRKRREPESGEFPTTDPITVPVVDSEVTTYTYGWDLYEDMLTAIRQAEKTVFFEIYIWKDDAVGRRFRQELIAAAERGVHVYVIVDVFGNLNQDPRFRHFPDLPTLHVRRFPLFRPGILIGNLRNSGRDHRKILAVDSKVAFVGGYNIGQLYADSWRDTHIRISGPQAWEIENAFIDMWNAHRKRGTKRLLDEGAKAWTPEVRVVQNLPSRLSFPIRAIYFDALDRATSHAWIIPDRDLLESIVEAARRGVDVRILLPEYSNHILADWAGRPYYHAILEAGARIFLYQGAMVHAKTMTVDGIWSTVGTANIDRLSMAGNFEVNAEIFDKDQAETLERIFHKDLTNCRELSMKEWENRHKVARVIERILRPLGFLG